MCEMPLTFDPGRINEGGDIEATLRRNVAKYHTSCRRMFNNAKLGRARKQHSGVHSKSEEGQTKHHRTSHDSEVYILCDRIAPASDLRTVMTMHPNNRLHECATTLNDGKLLARLSGGDAIVQELKYHRTSLTDLYNRETSNLKSFFQSEAEPDVYPLVLSELVSQRQMTSSLMVQLWPIYCHPKGLTHLQTMEFLTFYQGLVSMPTYVFFFFSFFFCNKNKFI